MRFYLFLLAVAVCEAKRITRGVDYFPNLRTVYHGNGATSYQNVQIDNHDTIPVPANYIDHAEIHDLEHTNVLEHLDHHEEIIPIKEYDNDIDHIDVAEAAPYEEFIITDLEPDVLEHHFDHYDDEHNYEFHLRK